LRRVGGKPEKQVVTYVRMRRRKREMSLARQAELVARYARRRGLIVVKVYKDGSGGKEWRSGE
jgi:hypothetical protein